MQEITTEEIALYLEELKKAYSHKEAIQSTYFGAFIYGETNDSR